MKYDHSFIENVARTYDKPHLIFKESENFDFENKFVAFITLTLLGGFVQFWKKIDYTAKEYEEKVKGSQLKNPLGTFLLIDASVIHSYGYGDDIMNRFDMLKLLVMADKDKHPLLQDYNPYFKDFVKFLVHDDANGLDIRIAGDVSPIIFASV